MPPRFHSLEISSIERFGDFAVALRFAVPDALADAYAFVPGQYLTLRDEIDGIEVRRPYSICTAPTDDGIGVGIKYVEGGVFSSHALAHLSVGDCIDVMTPQGRFAYSRNEMTKTLIERGTKAGEHILLLAAGSGITPILSIAKTALANGPDDRVTLIYGNRNTASIMFHDAVEDLKDLYLDRFRLLHVLSREARDVEVLNGRLDQDKIAALRIAGLIAPEELDGAFICGPDSMIADCRDALVDAGMAADRIAFERFTPAVPPKGSITAKISSNGVSPAKNQDQGGAAAACEVTIHINGITRQISMDPASQTVLSAGQSAGLEMPFSCEAGMCCTCRCKLVEGDIAMDANYSLEPWEMESGFILSCQARPLTKKISIDFDAV